MRNGNRITVPVTFVWRVPRAGYRWMDHEKGRFICAIDALRPDWPASKDAYESPYKPFERTGLFQEFADLKPDEDAVLGFANRFGLLDNGGNLAIDTEFGPALVHGETLALWKEEIEALKAASALWKLASAKDARVVHLGQQLKKLDMPLAVRRRFHFDEDDPAMGVLSAIQRLSDIRLQQHCQPRLLFQSDAPRLGIALMPLNLLGMLWLQFAVAVDALKSFYKCEQCGTPFEVSRDPSTGKRPDARFCKVRCRVGYYRGRLEEARRLRSAGVSVREIARRLKTRNRIVRSWTASPDRKTKRG